MNVAEVLAMVAVLAIPMVLTFSNLYDKYLRDRLALRRFPHWRWQLAWIPQEEYRAYDYEQNDKNSTYVPWQWLVGRLSIHGKRPSEFFRNMEGDYNYRRHRKALGSGHVIFKPVVKIDDARWSYYVRMSSKRDWRQVTGLNVIDALGADGYDVADGFEQMREGAYVNVGTSQFMALSLVDEISNPTLLA